MGWLNKKENLFLFLYIVMPYVDSPILFTEVKMNEDQRRVYERIYKLVVLSFETSVVNLMV